MDTQNPLLIPEVASMVLKALNSSVDLLHCRRVNRAWSSLATKLVQARPDLFISISNLKKVKEFDTDFNFLSDSASFPCHNFILEAALASDVRFHRFFWTHSRHIRKLVLSNVGTEEEDDRLHTMFRFIFHEVPQVEYIEVHSIDGPTLSLSDVDVGLILKSDQPRKKRPKLDLGQRKTITLLPVALFNLKRLKFCIPPGVNPFITKFIRKVIEVAPNLQALNVPLSFSQDIDLISWIIDVGRAEIIREISFDEEFEDHIQIIEGFSNENSQVSEIHEMELTCISTSYRHLWQRLTNCFNKIFKSSANTLEFLSIYPMGFLRGLQLQNLRHIKELYITVDNYSLRDYGNNDNDEEEEEQPLESRLFYNSKSFSQETFPALKTVTIFWEKDLPKNHEWEKTFGSELNVFETVQDLTLQHVACSGNWLEMISKSFPNAKELTVGSLHQTDPVKTFMWRMYLLFLNLEKMVINNIHDPLIKRVSYMDACVTGFTEEKCDHLRRFPDSSVLDLTVGQSETDTDPLPQQPSIANMKKLKSLILLPCTSLFKIEDFMKLQCSSGCQPSAHEPQPNYCAFRIFSKVASIHAFQMSPELEVVVRIGGEQFYYKQNETQTKHISGSGSNH